MSQWRFKWFFIHFNFLMSPTILFSIFAQKNLFIISNLLLSLTETMSFFCCCLFRWNVIVILKFCSISMTNQRFITRQIIIFADFFLFFSFCDKIKCFSNSMNDIGIHCKHPLIYEENSTEKQEKKRRRKMAINSLCKK